MHRRSFLTALSSLPFLGWLRPEPALATLQPGGQWVITDTSLPQDGACCLNGECLFDLTKPECDEIGGKWWPETECEFTGWHTVLPCPCGGEHGVCVNLSDSFHGDGKCGDCGAEYVAHLRHGGSAATTLWHLERIPPAP